jgi:hypothetical protein
MSKQVSFIHTRATTFDKVPIQIKVNGVVEDITGSTILMQLRKSEKGVVIYTVSNTITDGVNGIFELDEQFIDILTCRYQFDIEITFATGTFAGQTQRFISGLFIIEPAISETP